MMWLPFYIQEGLGKSGAYKEIFAALYDVGAIVGTIAAGLTSDRIGGYRMLVLEPMLILSLPILLGFRFVTDETFGAFYFLVLFVGVMIGGVAGIVSSAIAADLGRRGDVGEENLATIAGIIDGTGAIGAALG
jgi:sugar phosphate permease